MLLGAASQRVEYLALEFIGTPWLLDVLADWKRHERGALPGPTEFGIIFYIISRLRYDRENHIFYIPFMKVWYGVN